MNRLIKLLTGNECDIFNLWVPIFIPGSTPSLDQLMYWFIMGYLPARIDKVFDEIPETFKRESRLYSAGDLRDHLLLHLRNLTSIIASHKAKNDREAYQTLKFHLSNANPN
jgi:hypothetical protein